MPSQAAMAQFRELSASPPKTQANMLLSVFYSNEELGESNCTRAEGRKLTDQGITIAIKGNVSFTEFTNYVTALCFVL